ncbi:MAG TPA: SpoIIE family protein phosphatase [Azonexus sp.]|nr:SpoIIE family protein phosphatase [Azonexus sp.]
MENVALCAAPLAVPYEYAVASRALAGERQSGDAALVCASGDDGILVAVVDGLGHGDEAALAAEVAIRTLREHAGQPVATLFQRCHENLQQTRGAAIALAVIETSSQSMTWAGVGNVEGILVGAGPAQPRSKQYLTNRGGVVGYRLPTMRASQVSILPGDLLIFATDGVDECFTLGELRRGGPNVMARAILDRHGKTTDDALVLVLRWPGPLAGESSGSAA